MPAANKKPLRFTVIWKNGKGKFQFFFTDSEHTALKKEALTDGTCYIDTRHPARLRLYKYLLRKESHV